MNQLRDFISESLRIEGIHRGPTKDEIAATREFVNLPRLRLIDLEDLVHVYEPSARLRRHTGMNVQVGAHIPPRGGPQIELDLIRLLDAISDRTLMPYEGHVRYQNLHPFMDANGRSGRAVWLWHMHGEAPLGFLHKWYYQSLDANDYRQAQLGAQVKFKRCS